MGRKPLTDLIARAIKDADRRYFFEDYTRQAQAVQAALKQAGLAIVPVDPTEAMLEAGKNGMRYGQQRPQDLLKAIYQSMVTTPR
jgi:DNA-binding FrmR family transcriptional regulator